MTPEHFQQVALGWIGAVGVVLTALVGLVSKLWGEVKGAHDRIDGLSANARSDRQTLTQIALNTPAPGQKPPDGGA